MKDIINVTIDEKHNFVTDVTVIGRKSENNVTQLKIKLYDTTKECWAFLDFKKPNNEKIKTPEIDIEEYLDDKFIIYDIPEFLLDTEGELQAQLVLQNQEKIIWKSSIKSFYIESSVNATDDIPEKEDFITNAQKILDEVTEFMETDLVGKKYIVDDEEQGEIFNDYENNVASGEYSHAEGKNTQTNISSGHVEGNNTNGVIKGYRILKCQVIYDNSYILELDSIEGIEANMPCEIYTKTENGVERFYGRVIKTYGKTTDVFLAKKNGDNIDNYFKSLKFPVEPNGIYDILIINGGTIGSLETFDTDGNFSQHGEGINCFVGLNSHAEGEYNQAIGYGSHAEGYYTKSLAERSHTEGVETTATGKGSHAEGNQTKSIGEYSHAEGQLTTAFDTNAHAEGYNTYASGKYSHTEGRDTRASYAAHAEGRECEAWGNGSHAEGRHTITQGNYSHAEGLYTIASSEHQHVQGMYNDLDTENKYAHIVGNGTGEDVLDEKGNIITKNRSNAHTVDWDGNGWFAGNLRINGDKEVATKKYVDNEIATFDFIKIVDVLPEKGLENRFYFVPKADTQTQDLFDEYAWINDKWEWITTKQIEVDLTEYAKNTDLPKVSYTYGIYKTSGGVLYIDKATQNAIEDKKDDYHPIVPANLDYAVKSVVGGHITLTQAEYDALETKDENTYYYIKEEE